MLIYKMISAQWRQTLMAQPTFFATKRIPDQPIIKFVAYQPIIVRRLSYRGRADALSKPTYPWVVTTESLLFSPYLYKERLS